MSGTRPLTDQHDRTVVQLVTGLSKTPKLKFAWGVRSEVISVGMRAKWAILADKVTDLHMHLGFDGERLLVALASPDAVVQVNGTPIHGQGWWPVPVPGEIRAGCAVFKVEAEGPAWGATVLAPPEGEAADTVHDGGVLRERARVISNQKGSPSAPPPGAAFEVLPTMLSAGHQQPQAPGPIPATVLSAGTGGFAPQAVRPAALAAAGAQALPGTGPDAMTVVGRSAPPAIRQSAPPAAARPSAAPAAKPTAAAARPSAAPASPSVPPVAIPEQAPESELRPAMRRGAWSQASTPKKAILLLLPFAAAVTVWSWQAEDVRPGAASAAARPSAKPAASASAGSIAAAASPQPAAAPTPPASASAEPAANPTLAVTPPAPPVEVTDTAAAPTRISARAGATGALAPDRAARSALDQAFLGNLSDASHVYGQLAAANPADPAFALAARLTAAQSVRRP